MRATFTVAIVMLGLSSSCSRSGDENLGLQSQQASWSIDTAQLTRPGELVRAASMPGHELDKKLGAHRFDASSKLKLELPGNPSETLDESYLLSADGHGGFHAVHDNSHGNGFEAALIDGYLYVKARYGRTVKRKPEGDEAERMRASVEGVSAKYLELLSRWLVVHEDGRASVAGRPALKLKLSAAATPHAAPAELDPGRKWRQTLNVRYIDGSALVDAATGALVGLQLDAAYSFFREEAGKKTGPIAVTLTLRQTAGAPETIVAPNDFVDSPHRTRVMLDRAELLEGLK